MRLILKLLLSLGILALCILIAVVSLSIWTAEITTSRTYTLSDLPPSDNRIAIVLGAGLNADGTPSRILQQRIDVARTLYQEGIVSTLLLSGDGNDIYYSETRAMHAALLPDVPDENMLIDTSGLSTYDTCYRAKHTYNIDRAIIITQRFHVPRTIHTCSTLGMDTIGVIAEGETTLQHKLEAYPREFAAIVKAYIELYFTKPTP